MFNALSAAGLRAHPTHPTSTMVSFTQLDQNRQPNRKDILQLRREALAVAKQISTDGTLWGYTGLVVQGADYTRITNNAPPYQIPVHPGNVVPQGANQLAAYHNEEHHKRQLKCHEEHKWAENLLHGALTAAVPAIYLEVLEDPEAGLSGVTVLQMFAHLMTAYGAVMREDLDRNEDDLKAPWNPSAPIETLWLQASRAQQFPPPTDALSDNYILRALVNNVRNTQAFASTLKRFEDLALADQTLARFKTEMNRSYKAWVLANKDTTSSQAGYSSANLLQDQPAAATPSLATSKYAFAVGSKVYAYCWTHGLSQVRDVSSEHNSTTCANRHDGHQVEATFDAQMGGCNPCNARHVNRRPNPNP